MGAPNPYGAAPAALFWAPAAPRAHTVGASCSLVVSVKPYRENTLACGVSGTEQWRTVEDRPSSGGVLGRGLENHDFQAQEKRRTNTAQAAGFTLSDAREFLYQSLPGLYGMASQTRASIAFSWPPIRVAEQLRPTMLWSMPRSLLCETITVNIQICWFGPEPIRSCSKAGTSYTASPVFLVTI